MVLSQHYEVFIIPVLFTTSHGEDDDDYETQHLSAADSVEYWPPSTFTTHVFYSRKWRWEERSFVRQGDPAGTIADMISHSDRSLTG
jgi:hypothetical protein